MGQPGDVLTNRAGYSNFWEFNYLNKGNFGYINSKNIRRMLYTFFKYSHSGSTNNVVSHRWFLESKDFPETEDLSKFYRKVEVRNPHIDIRSRFLARKAFSYNINSKVWLQRHSGWLLINWVCFKPKLEDSAWNWDLGSKSTTYLHYLPNYLFYLKRFIRSRALYLISLDSSLPKTARLGRAF